MRRAINNENVEGRVYQHNLVIKQVSNKESANYGKDFISGTIEVATDEDCLNVIPVHYTYVTEITSKGGVNPTYTNLKRIIDGGKTVIADGKDAALKVRLNPTLSLNEFYRQDGQLVSTKQNEGGFVSIISELSLENERNTFTEDMLITKAQRVEADPDKDIKEDYLILGGYIFDFRNSIMPVEFTVRHADGINHFEGLEPSEANPVYTKLWGKINCNTITVERREESAFGEAAVRTYERKTREWLVTGTASEPYDLGDDSIITSEEVKKALQDREVMLAGIKKRAEDYRANNSGNASTGTSAAPTSGPGATVKTGTFSF